MMSEEDFREIKILEMTVKYATLQSLTPIFLNVISFSWIVGENEQNNSTVINCLKQP